MGHGRGVVASPVAGTRIDPTRVAQASLGAAVVAVGQTAEAVPAILVRPRARRLEKAGATIPEITGLPLLLLLLRRRMRRLVGDASASQATITVRMSTGVEGGEARRGASEEPRAAATPGEGPTRTAPGTGTIILLGTGPRKELPAGAPRGKGRTRWGVGARCITTGAEAGGGAGVTGRRAMRAGGGRGSRREVTRLVQTVRESLPRRRALAGVEMRGGRNERVAPWTRVGTASWTPRAHGKEGDWTSRCGTVAALEPEARGSGGVRPAQASTPRPTGTATLTPGGRARGPAGSASTGEQGSQIFATDQTRQQAVVAVAATGMAAAAGMAAAGGEAGHERRRTTPGLRCPSRRHRAFPPPRPLPPTRATRRLRRSPRRPRRRRPRRHLFPGRAAQNRKSTTRVSSSSSSSSIDRWLGRAHPVAAGAAPGTAAVGAASPSTLVARPRAATERTKGFDHTGTAPQVFRRRATPTAAAAATAAVPGPDQAAADHHCRVLVDGAVPRRMIDSRATRDREAAAWTPTPQAVEVGAVKTPTKDQENLVPSGTRRAEEEGASSGKGRVTTTTTSTATTTTAAAVAVVAAAAAAAVARVVSGLAGELTAAAAAGFQASTTDAETSPVEETWATLVAGGVAADEAEDAGGGGGGDSTTGITAERLRWRLGQPLVRGVRLKSVCF